jgi:hypothetical protein
MSVEEQNMKLGGHIALLKVQSSKTAEFCATTALQVDRDSMCCYYCVS